MPLASMFLAFLRASSSLALATSCLSEAFSLSNAAFLFSSELTLLS